MKQGYFGRMVQYLESNIQTLSQTKANISAGRAELAMRKIAFDREVINQQEILQREITWFQNELQLQKKSVSPACSEMTEKDFQKDRENFQDILDIFARAIIPPLPQPTLDSYSHEADLLRRLGKLQGIIIANQHASTIPFDSTRCMVMKLAKKIVVRHFELQQELSELEKEREAFHARLFDIIFEVGKKNSQRMSEHVETIATCAQLEQGSDQSKDYISMVETRSMRWAEMIQRSIARTTDIAKEQPVDTARIISTHQGQGDQFIFELWQQIITGFIYEEGLTSNSSIEHMVSILLELAETTILQNNHLQARASSRSSEQQGLKESMRNRFNELSNMNAELITQSEKHIPHLTNVNSELESILDGSASKFHTVVTAMIREIMEAIFIPELVEGDATVMTRKIAMGERIIELVMSNLKNVATFSREARVLVERQVSGIVEKTISHQQQMISELRRNTNGQLNFHQRLRNDIQRHDKEFCEAVDGYLSKLVLVIDSEEDGQKLEKKLKMSERALEYRSQEFQSTMRAFDSLAQSSGYDPSQLNNYVEQSARIIEEINETVRTLAQTDSERLNQMARNSIEAIRMLTQGPQVYEGANPSTSGQLPSPSSEPSSSFGDRHEFNH